MTAERPSSRKRNSRRQRLPKGWTEQKIKEVIGYYDQQTDDEAVAEYEAAMNVASQSLLLVPSDLVTEIREFIAQRKGA